MSKKKLKIALKAFCISLACALIICAVVFSSIFAANKIGYGNFSSIDNVYQIAHRGYSDIAPENTLPAFIEAGKSGVYYGAECDIRLSKDGIWVISHDDDVERMTDGTGKISEMSYDEISVLNIDFGANIQNYPNLSIPTLTEYLDVCALYKMRPFIEVKESDPECVDSLYDMLEQKKLLGNANILSFDKKILKAFNEKEYKVNLFLLTKTIKNSDIKFCEENNCILDFSESKALNTVSRMNKAQKHGISLAAWTVKDTDAYIRLVDNGVLYITTNSPIDL